MLKIAASVFLFVTLGAPVLAHMEMTNPPPRESKFNPYYKDGQIDYDMTSPLGGQWTYPCRGYGPGPSVATYQAGGTVGVDLDGGAVHNGGHCQFSLSVDGGKTFVVMKTVMGDCMIAARHYDVPIPKNAPNGKATFAWTWINKTGNREYYMNCADITIQGGSGKCISGPKNLIADLPGYPTIPEFTNGGYDGSDLMAKRPIVTSCSNGSTSDDSGSNPPPASSSTSSSSTPSKAATSKKGKGESYKKPEEARNEVPATGNSSGSGTGAGTNYPSEPSNGNPTTCESKCLGGPHFQVCGNGGTTAFKMVCALGTTCHMQDGVVACY
ncbi:hypothetical protein K493DRAFT_298154 [Basidiobolus meristosporus CBS 931.73]|uniref:Chitin-binding type-4 domain-containing protein n=1 Tax=Basidiobolus meristosporus CBS 931.73 TaxID=1314790 RepID=A0A1Y1YV99_9FUNG|nr:hypothetical protein K493DRAFT_298154 [Basidiobolus meristosporus CBS 931.73]|eukprot:ORY01958.1 hypothetical protein K493DRAFT_298154 [Basidiobolus meristosporus CBS 931.73]